MIYGIPALLGIHRMTKKYTEAEAIANFHAGSVVNEETPDKCLEWQRGLSDGYGRLSWNGKHMLTHRLAFQLHHGRPITEGMCILHSCDNRKCCKPSHLREGTNKENVDDKMSRDRMVSTKGEANGRAKLTLVQVAEIKVKYSSGKYTQVSIGAEYGVGQYAISSIILNRTWKDTEN